MAAPRMVGWADGAIAPVYVAVGAGCILLGTGLKEIDQWFVKRGAATESNRTANILGDLNNKLARTINQTSSSQERLETIVSAVQHCTLSLLKPAHHSLRVCIYQLDYDEEQMPANTKPGDRPIEQARLLLVGEPLGRGTDAARAQFKYDDAGKDTLTKILARQHVWCRDTKKRATPGLQEGRSYRSYLSVPILIGGEVEGMLTCDAQVKSDLKERMAPVLRMTAIVAGIGLRQSEVASQPVKPTSFF
ncbi:hypothetical protein ABL57_19880 [Kocuria sp. SM24M-10]|nr:hypothetical protein ABL57_19880 [Kocuria sp. SM24M-10]